MNKTKIKIDKSKFPEQIQYLFENSDVYDSSCHSNAKVYYVDSGYYIKVDELNSLKNEYKMNYLFYKIGFGVEVIHYISSDMDYLVTRSAIGYDLTHCVNTPEKLCEILVLSLKELHSKPIDGFPHSTRYQRYLEAYNNNFKHGYYDESVLMNRYLIHSKEEAIDIINADIYLLNADTLIHGDACLPNVIQNDGEFSCFIDFDMSGIGDKHIDLYWAIWSLQYNLKTDEYTDLFLDLYGREEINEKVLKLIAAFELLG